MHENFVFSLVATLGFIYFWIKQDAPRQRLTQKLAFSFCRCARLSLFLHLKGQKEKADGKKTPRPLLS